MAAASTIGKKYTFKEYAQKENTKAATVMLRELKISWFDGEEEGRCY